MSGQQQQRPPTVTYRLDANPCELQFREEVLKTGEFSDVSFLVGDQTKRVFKAHRFILAAGSQIFRDMLRGRRAMSEIAIPNVNPNNFVQLLNVIYLNCFELYSPKMAIGCLQLFQEHNLKNAVRMCHAYLARGKQSARKPPQEQQVTEKPTSEPTPKEKPKSRPRRRYGKTLPPRRKEEKFWRPTILCENDLRSEEERDNDELYRKLRGALNKLTYQNFDKLNNEVLTLLMDKVNTYDQAKSCIKLIIEKAISEPMYCSMYAKFCKLLAPIPVSYGKLTFGQVLLLFCSAEFACQIDRDDLEDQLYKTAEKRAIAIMIFHGEIFKVQLETSDAVIVVYIDLLLDLNTNNSLEGLCELLIRVGKYLQSKLQSHPETLPKLYEIFKKLEDIIQNPYIVYDGLSNKTRFAIMDVIELRNDQWEPRRKGMIKKIAEWEQTQQIVIEPEPEEDLEELDLEQQMDEMHITEETEVINETPAQ